MVTAEIRGHAFPSLLRNGRDRHPCMQRFLRAGHLSNSNSSAWLTALASLMPPLSSSKRRSSLLTELSAALISMTKVSSMAAGLNAPAYGCKEQRLKQVWLANEGKRAKASALVLKQTCLKMIPDTARIQMSSRVSFSRT